MGEITIQNKQQNYTESRIKHRKEQTIRREKNNSQNRNIIKKKISKEKK